MTERGLIVNAPNGEAVAELARTLVDVCDLLIELGDALKTPPGQRLAAEVRRHKERAERLLQPERRGGSR